MSSYDSQSSGRQVQAIDLSDGEKALRDKILANPMDWPDSTKVWFADYISMNSLIPISQVQGFSQFLAQQNVVATGESTSSTSYTDLATAGPEITGLSKGTYLIMFGAVVQATSNGWTGAVSVSVNGASAVDADGFSAGWVVSEGPAVENLSIPSSRALVKTLDQSNNTITMKYRLVANSAPTFENRWLVALRVSN